MLTKLACREEEVKALDTAIKSNTSEFIAVYGRRRIGKTYLIHHYCKSIKCVYFHMTGIRDGSYQEQLEVFMDALSETFYHGVKLEMPKSWLKALDLLNKALKNIHKNKKVVLFFDEFPWMVTRRSRLLQALEYQWNRNWAFEGRVKLIICGSASSWVLKNIIHNTGGLYNRVTHRLHLKPFDLYKTKIFLDAQGIKLDHNKIVELYMVMGGVPYYLSQVQKSYSITQNIDKILFRTNSNLYNEYKLLLHALFENAEDYDLLIRHIAKYRYGVSQAELLKAKNISRGGRAVMRLKELEDIGFIQSFIPRGHKIKGKYYKVVDEYILFYLHWIEPTLLEAGRNKKVWHNRAKSVNWKIWTGLAFESLCYKHITQIAETLEIDAGALAYSWRYIPLKGEPNDGAQIDLLFDRNDNAITLCEIRYTDKLFVIDKQCARNLLNKKKVFQKQTGTKKQIFIAMITTHGVGENLYSEDIIDGIVTLDDLFKIVD